MIKIITGIRRCGKSYLLFHLFRKYLLENGIKEEQIIAISLEDEENKDYLDPSNLYKYIKSKIKDDKNKYYVLLDEAQLVSFQLM